MSPLRTRVSLLSPRAARIEITENGQFLDGPSFFFISRLGEAHPWPGVEREGTVTTHRSDHLEITVEESAGFCSPQSLEINWRWEGRSGSWRPGDLDARNLGGAFSALDNVRDLTAPEGVHVFDPLEGHDAYRCSTHDLCRAVEQALIAPLGHYPEQPERDEEIRRLCTGEEPKWLRQFSEEIQSALARVRRFPPGFLSRSGLTVIRDAGPMWDPERQWFMPRPAAHLMDLTVIACGDDYAGTLREIQRLAGPMPTLPRWARGIWFSCFRRMGTAEFQQIAEDFAEHDLPLDVLVVDTDWHTHRWHGFDWNPELFPDPEAFFAWLRTRDIHTTFNVHPGYIPADDSRLPAYREASGDATPPLTEEEAPHPLHAGCVPIDLMDPEKARAYLDVFHGALLDQGVDLWWLDGATEHWDGEEGTAWLNHLHAEHARGHGSLPISFSRASGLGCHRCTLPFSGDAWSQWDVLGVEVEQTVRGACALLGHWSHDIGGFWLPGDKANKPADDLFLRWVQFGALSPVFRLHSDHGVREPWLFEAETLRLCRESMRLRVKLIPRMEAAERDGLPLWRPMCFACPGEEEAYQRWRQAMIGDDLLFAPVWRENGEVEVWFPPGQWRHLQRDQTFKGPRVEQWIAGLQEIPVFVRMSAKA